MSVVSPWYQLGYVIPHLRTDMDAYQFYKVAPDGVMLVTTQLDLKEYSLASVEEELPTFWHRTGVLAEKGVDRLALSGVPLAASLGRARTLALLDEAAQRTGLPCDTDLEAHIAALQHLGATRIALATRWPDALNAHITTYLGEAGIEVLSCRSRGRDLKQNKAADAAADHDLALELGRQALEAAPGAQALLLPGGLWFAIHAAPVLEAETGVPVLLNITSTLWAALHARSEPLLHRPDARWGRLLAGL